VGWAIIFARVLLGYLNAHPEVRSADLIIPMPAVNPEAITPPASSSEPWNRTTAAKRLREAGAT
jgi:hypothetical protein